MKTKRGMFRVAVVSAMLLCVSPAVAGDLKEELIAMEKTAWQEWVDGDGEAYGDRLTEDAVLAVAGDSVTRGRDAIKAGISSHDCEIENLDFADFKLRELSSDIVILTYTATSETTCQGQSLPSSVYSSSIYVRQGGKWLITSYQETAL